MSVSPRVDFALGSPPVRLVVREGARLPLRGSMEIVLTQGGDGSYAAEALGGLVVAQGQDWLRLVDAVVAQAEAHYARYLAKPMSMLASPDLAARSLLSELFSLEGPLGDFLHDFAAIVEEVSQPNWDGESSHPVSGKSAAQAMEFFLATLPLKLPFPEVSVMPDGDVMLDWYPESRWCFSVAFSDDGRLHYAGLFDREELVGATTFSPCEAIPGEVLRGIRIASQRMPGAALEA